MSINKAALAEWLFESFSMNLEPVVTEFIQYVNSVELAEVCIALGFEEDEED